ncbi:pyridoxamine 5'-phosphate oxidase [Polycladidibacter stylochi]|uniref:pyridoxamine 5'-phosphate oxidase n=1 Tax=Polycladidibacter stylochi TaxID=1807766 RepID=UPI000B03E694|nr:pyridoxamine 5'-phosphate oxidase [Pseudovibrio stylochi]
MTQQTNNPENKFTNDYFEKVNAPYELFQEWMVDAQKKEVNDPNAMALSTVDDQGMPNIRMVLLKGCGPEGFTFYTNLESNKGKEIENNPKVALNFHWKSLRRQVRVRGIAHKVTQQEADTYFASRPRKSRIGAWASKQSRPLESRFALEKEVAKYSAKYAIGDIPRPEYWTGFCVEPIEVEFWNDRAFRLHDRFVMTKDVTSGVWQTKRLYP